MSFASSFRNYLIQMKSFRKHVLMSALRFLIEELSCLGSVVGMVFQKQDSVNVLLCFVCILYEYTSMKGNLIIFDVLRFGQRKFFKNNRLKFNVIWFTIKMISF